MVRRCGWLWSLIMGTFAATGCTFNFDVTSQRTALENQVMGSYKELDDDLILASSVRGPNKAAKVPGKVSANKRRALDARQNQQFNQDDLEEFKQQQVLGEAADGTVVMLPRGLAKGTEVPAKVHHLAEQIAAEENRDREVIWRRIIESNEHLSERDLPNVRLTYAKMLREAAGVGIWYQDDARRWLRKSASDASEL